MMMVEYFGIVLATAGSAALFTWGMWSLNREILQKGEGEDEDTAGLVKSMGPYMRVFGDVVVGFFELFKVEQEESNFAKVYVWRFYTRLNNKLKEDLIHSSRDNQLSPREMWGMCVCSAIGGGVFGLLFFLNFPSPFVLVLPAMLGVVLPFIWIGEDASRRQRAVGRALPFSIDLLSLMMRSGLDFSVGLERMIRELPKGPLMQEYSKVCQQMRMGDSRADALQNLALRTGVPSVGIFTSAVIHSDRMGGEITAVLDVQAQTLRVKRFQTAEGEAGKAPVKMLFPLLLLIFPTIFLVLFGPLLIRYQFS